MAFPAYVSNSYICSKNRKDRNFGSLPCLPVLKTGISRGVPPAPERFPKWESPGRGGVARESRVFRLFSAGVDATLLRFGQNDGRHTLLQHDFVISGHIV